MEKKPGFKTSSNSGKATLTCPFPNDAMEFTHAVTISGDTNIFPLCICRLPLLSTQLASFFSCPSISTPDFQENFLGLDMTSVKVATEVNY